MNNRPLPLGARGFSLVELMIALALGLFLTGVAINVVVLNRQAFQTTENLSRMQENARSAFELLARDIRTAGGNPCGTPAVVNVLSNPTTFWWSNWAGGSLIGYENGAAPQNYGSPAQNAPALALIKSFSNGARDLNSGPTGIRNPIVANTDAILLLSGDASEGVPILGHNPTAAAIASPPSPFPMLAYQFVLNANPTGFAQNDILMACDNHNYTDNTLTPFANPVATIFQAAGAAGNGVTYNVGGAVANVTPGNISTGLGSLPNAPNAGIQKTFGSGGFLSRLSAAFWYVGNNGRGSNSLYRVSMNGRPTEIQSDEIIDNVCVQGMNLQPENRPCQGLQITYVTRNTTTGVVAAAAAPGIDWTVTSQFPKPGNASEVIAVRISLDLQSREASGIGTANNASVTQRLATNITETVFLRSRDATQ